MTNISFSDLPLSEKVLNAISEMGFSTPTPVQSAAIPLAFTGQDLMVQSQTGTGKTAAFGLPIIEKIITQKNLKGVRAMVLCPTRELARQVADELGRLAQNVPVQTVAVYGGASMEKQIAEMRFAQIVVGTPGRVLDHLKRKNLSLKSLDHLVLDEADEMLSMGFAQELSMIMRYVPTSRQTLLFSATIPEDIKRMASRYMREPEFLSLIEENVGADDVTHRYYMVSGVGRTRDLVQVLEYENPESALIFTNTRKDSEIVARSLKRQGYQAEYLNGDLPQRSRERILQQIKDKELRFLVATDIAARGIDISQLSHVINYLLPESPEVYIHRTGRTGRAGHSGIAVSLIGPREIGVYYYLKRVYNVALQERMVPTQAEIDLRREERRTEALITEIMKVAPAPEGQIKLRPQVMRLLEREDAPEIVSALLGYFHGSKDAARVPAAGGVLKDVPQPDRIMPGGRAQTVSSVERRVAIVQGEFRGRPEAKERPKRQPEVHLAPTPEIAEAPVEPEVEAVVEATPEVEAVVEAAVEAQPEIEATPEVEAPVEPQPEPEVEVKAEVEAPVEAPEASEGAAPLARLFVNVGRRDGVKSEVLIEQLSDLGGLLPEDFIDVSVRSRHTFVKVDRDYAEDLIEAVNGEAIGRRSLRIEFARDD